jgi:hypothetical protein
VLDGPMTGVAFAAVEPFPGAGARAPCQHPLPAALQPRSEPEQLFAKLKARLRKAATQTREEVWSTIARLLDACPSAEFANYFNHCGYGST